MFYLPPTLISIIEVLLVIVPALLSVAYVTVAERKTMASMQRRLGPNAVGYYGLLQAFADALKLLLKEYVAPTQANIILFFLGPVITLVFALLGYGVIPYGPGLAISDFNLGILYMLAVSSLATYGILLAGYPQIMRKLFILLNESVSYSLFFCIIVFLLLIDNTYCLLIIYGIFMILLLDKVTNKVIYPLFLDKKYKGCLLQKYRPINNNKKVSSIYRCGYYFTFNKVESAFIKNTQKRTIHTTKHLSSTYRGTDKPNIQESNMKSLHLTYINELYKDRAAPVIPFNRESILATCTNFHDKNARVAFLKEWRSKSGIYLIEYKYDPLIYYIGRTTLFKRRFNNHLKAESGSKLHIFLNLIGWEHFNISIVETCSLDKLGERENFYIQNYLPLLNSVFFSSMTETAINTTLKSKLDSLRESNSSVSFKYNEKAATEKKSLISLNF